MMRVVFDTNVLISSTLWEGSVAQKLLFKCIDLNISIFSSTEILSEYKKVLKRDFGYADDEVTLILEKIMQYIRIVQPKEKVDAIKEDPEDNKILECAMASSSQCIITYDKHILKLKEFRGIRIIKLEEALTVLQSP